MKIYGNIFCITFLITLATSCVPATKSTTDLDRTLFVDVKSLIPSLVLEIRYFGNYNFVGERIDGYQSPRCLLTEKAARALKKVQKDLRKKRLSLIVYDCYRPEKAVDHFVRWAKDLNDTKMKSVFYPQMKKTSLFKKGYIAEKSGHSRGSTVDVGLIALPDISTGPTAAFKKKVLDMGTHFDYFGERSHTRNGTISLRQKSNRMILKNVMEKNGFKNLAEEWWHYTLIDEPFRDTYFNFEIE